MRLLYISPRECWPPTSGAKLRDYYFARGLAQGSELTYVFFGTEESADSLAQTLNSETEIVAVRTPEKYSAAKLVRGLTGKYPLPVQNYTSVEMRKALSVVLARKTFDAVHLDSIHLASYVQLIRAMQPKLKLILNWHNIESELMERYAGSTPSVPRKAYARVTAAQMRRLERAMLRSCNGHLVCSEREFQALSSRDDRARIAVAPNGVDTEFFSPLEHERIQNRLVFVGQMSYHANADAALWFVREIWPAVRARYAEMELSIVGSSPGPALQALSKEQGLHVTGTVPDVRPFYAGARAAIVPLLTGGGTRLKILEAMAAGTPVISTPLGAEGLPVSDRETILFAQTADDWVKALGYLSDEQRRARLIENARRLVVSRFDWNAIGEQVLWCYRDWLRVEA